MSKIDKTGIKSTSLAEYKSAYNTAYHSTYGADFDVSTQTPTGQEIAIKALNDSTLDDAIVSLGSYFNINNAGGVILDGMAAALNITRLNAQFSNVTCQLTGVTGTIIPKGSKVQTIDGVILQSDENITLSASAGTGKFTCLTSGAIVIATNSVTKIVDAVSGWETVNNSAAGALGRDKETDINFILRYFNTVGKNSRRGVDSVAAAIRDVATVTDVKVVNNDSGTTITVQNVTISAWSIRCLVQGGNDTDIATAILNYKGSGTPTDGAKSITLPENTLPIKFDSITLQQVVINITMSLKDTTASDYQKNIRDTLKNFFDEAINIGDKLYLGKIYNLVTKQTDVDIISITQEISGGSTQDIITPDLNQKLALTDPTTQVIFTIQ